MVLTANGLNICAEVVGSGPPLLFLGGTAWDIRRQPNPLQSSLPDHFTLALIDQRGLGQSDKPTGPYTMLDYATDAAGVLDALQWPSAHVVGYSFGGMVAQEVAIRHPTRVKKLVLAGSSPGGEQYASYPIEKLLTLPPRERARRGLEVADLTFSKEFQQQQPHQAEQRIEARLLAENTFLNTPDAQRGLEEQLAARSTHDVVNRLNRIEASTLIIAAEHDGQASREGQELMAERISDATFKLLPGSHGFINESTACYADIIEFLT